ncbi:TraB/GumN family protein [Pseudoxanthomonas mexicana]|uniref:TraB/GumN family protein n=1 Tax=Pseudoxanthomonas mexicana TaxID=128785 RepID=UPI00398A63CA
MRRIALSGLLGLWMIACAAHAQEPATAPPQAEAQDPAQDVIEMDTVTVSGVQPGPGLWKVSRGDHVLWVLGTVAPLPSGMEWKSEEVRGVLEQADQVLGPPGVAVGADIGFFRGMMLVPSALKAMKNPDGKTLQDMLPAETYARWAALKQQYIGRDGGVEKKRPFLAAQELYQHAIKRSGLGGGVVSPVIYEVLKRRKMKLTSTVLGISVDDPKAALADFRKEQATAQEVACMNEMLDTLEHDLPRMVTRANAWATGDLDALRALPLTERRSCWSVWADTETVRKRGMTDIQARIGAKWLEAAEAALAKNRTTFATLPVSDLFAPEGYFAQLQAKGYTVEAPL